MKNTHSKANARNMNINNIADFFPLPFILFPISCGSAPSQTEPPAVPFYFFLRARGFSPLTQKPVYQTIQPHYILQTQFSLSGFSLENIHWEMIEPGSWKPGQSVTHGEWLAAPWNSHASWDWTV